MSDQGREFVNKVNQELFDMCGTDHRISSAYHPQNGLDERMNQMLKGALVKFVNENQNDWDIHIKSVLFAYRKSKHDSTKFTPFELMFGRAPVLPIEMDIRSKPCRAETGPDFEEKVRVMMNIWDQVKGKARQNISNAQERQKTSYNAKHEPLHFQEGDTVPLKNKRNEARQGGKLERVWSGPYTISAVLPKGLYKLRDGESDLKTSYNSSRRKTYYHPSSAPQPQPRTQTQPRTETQPRTQTQHNVSSQDRDIILKKNQLNDIIIKRAQGVLSKQHELIGGWQDPLLSQTSFAVAADESVQIHHTGQNHWVCSSSIGGCVKVYDSSPSKKLTQSMEVQLCKCYKTAVKEKKLAVELPPVQIQRGVDCGLFAIAFATDIAEGNDPSFISYNQDLMREHLLHCLERQRFTPFPRQQKPAWFSRGHDVHIYVFCNRITCPRVLTIWYNVIYVNSGCTWRARSLTAVRRPTSGSAGHRSSSAWKLLFRVFGFLANVSRLVFVQFIVFCDLQNRRFL